MDYRYAVKEAHRNASVIDVIEFVVKLETVLGENDVSPFLSQNAQVDSPTVNGDVQSSTDRKSLPSACVEPVNTDEVALYEFAEVNVFQFSLPPVLHF
jgi:hypothetical protein